MHELDEHSDRVRASVRVQTYDSFDLSELTRATGAVARERTSEIGAGSRMQLLDM